MGESPISSESISMVCADDPAFDRFIVDRFIVDLFLH
jgi:hypothetical protein